MGNGNMFIQGTHAFNDSKIPFVQARVLNVEGRFDANPYDSKTTVQYVEEELQFKVRKLYVKRNVMNIHGSTIKKQERIF